MRITSTMVLVAALSASACMRSARDRELDRIFAHQRALRDTTASVIGTVVDDVTGAPLPLMRLMTAASGGESDSTGRFVIPSLPRGRHAIVIREPGYLPDSAFVDVAPPSESKMTLRARRAALPCCTLEGLWEAEFILDSAGTGQVPTARSVAGTVQLWRTSSAPARAELTPDAWVAEYSGYFNIDFVPFWGSQITPDVSTTVASSPDALWMRAAVAAVFNDDSTTWHFIPTVSHGGVSFAGRISGDDMIEGSWEQRAYCCGASGKFRLVRISDDPGERPTAPMRRRMPVDTLLDKDAGRVFVRVWDEAAGRYIKTRYSLQLAKDRWISSFAVGTDSAGWGQSYKLAPGRYRAYIDRYPCGREQLSLRTEIGEHFTIRAGARTEVTLTFNSLKVRAARTYNNTDGRRCEVDPRTYVPEGAFETATAHSAVSPT